MKNNSKQGVSRFIKHSALAVLGSTLPLIASAQLATNIGPDIRALSMGNAVTADPPGIMAIHYNPAGLAKLDGRRMDLQFLAVDMNVQSKFSAPPGYNVFGFSDDPVVCADAADSGSDVCYNFKESKSTVKGISLYLPIVNDVVNLPPGPLVAGPVPSFSIKPEGSKFTFATATYLPMAAGFYRDEDDPGVFMGKRVALNRITYLSPSVGYEVSDTLSIGASIGFSYQGVALETDFRTPNELMGFARIMDESICAPFKGESNFALDILLFGICNPNEGLGPFKSLASLDVQMDQRFSPSYNLGVLWEPRDDFAWGAVWHAPTKVHMKGKYSIKYSNAAQETVNGIGSSPTGQIALAVLGVPARIGAEDTGMLNMDLNMPSHFQTGIKFKPMEKLQLNMDAVWVDYSSWDAFNFQFDKTNAALSLARLFSPGSTSTSLSYPLGFRSTWNLAFGAEYSVNERLALRAGFEPRASAIPKNKRSPMVPINDANLYGVGIGYRWDQNTEIDLAAAYLHSKDNIPANSSCAANCEGINNMVYNPYAGLDIKTKAEIIVLGLAFRTRF